MERDGVRLTLKLIASPLIAGYTQRLSVTVENTADEPLHWVTDGCEKNMWIEAEMPEASWAASNASVSDELAPYRQWLRDNSGAEEAIRLNFDNPALVGYREVGCADVGVPHELAPGRSVTQTQLWNGNAYPRLGLPPNGRVRIVGHFDYWNRGNEQDRGEPLEVVLESWVINGRDPAALSPLEIIDAAVSDEQLASWLVTQPLHESADAIADYDVASGVWLVGLLTYRHNGRNVLHAAYLDAYSGEVFAIRESVIND